MNWLAWAIALLVVGLIVGIGILAIWAACAAYVMLGGAL